MSEDKSFKKKLDKFFEGKGFYIVLSLCIALIGVSAYYLLTGSETDVEDQNTLSENYTQWEEAQPPEVMTENPTEAEPAETEEPAETDETAEETGEETEDEAPVFSEEQDETSASAAMIWPVDGEIETPYSMTSLIYNKKLGDWRTSNSVEFAAPLGTQVLACGTGVVEKVYMDDMGGMTVIISHSGGLRSVYSNLTETPTVYEGDNVMTGEVIGSVGVTAVGETEENPHLCFAMTLDGQSVDPAMYLPAR